MPRPVRIDAPGAIHHVIARGNERKAVFRDDEDRAAFLATVERCQARLRFDVLAFCLMTNHVHFAVRTGPQPLARVALAVFSSYAGRFNRRHQRVGHLFQGRYKAHRITNNRHLLAVVRYIHRNPVMAGIVSKAERYRWSSDRLYRRSGLERLPWLDLTTVLGVLSTDPEDAAVRYRELIDVEEVATVADTIGRDEGARRPRVASEMEDSSVARFASAVSEATGEPLDWLRSTTKSRSASRARSLTAILARDVARVPLSRAAAFFGRDESVICRSVARLEARLPGDREVAELLRLLRSNLGEK